MPQNPKSQFPFSTFHKDHPIRLKVAAVLHWHLFFIGTFRPKRKPFGILHPKPAGYTLKDEAAHIPIASNPSSVLRLLSEKCGLKYGHLMRLHLFGVRFS